MKQIVKVSIAGVGFTLECDAHTMLDNYLDEIGNFYRSEKDGDEIIADIEERIAELLVERGGKGRVVAVADIEAVVSILGNPSQMEDGSSFSSPDKGEEASGLKKKIYRDVENRVLGGVCSGLGAYFGVDAVIVRVVYLLIALSAQILGAFGVTSIVVAGGSAFGFMTIVYIVLWIIMPAARTVEQRCAMHGKGSGVNDIRRDVRSAQSNGKNGKSDTLLGSVLGVVGVCIGVLLLICGFFGLLGGMVMLVGFDIIEGMALSSVIDYVDVGVDNVLVVKILGALVYAVPFLGMLYVGLLLCFKFKAPKWRPGVIMLLVWIASVIGLIAVGTKSVVRYMDETTWSEDTPLPRNIDTLYVNLELLDGIENYHRLDDDWGVDYIRNTERRGETEFVDYPEIRIIKHSPAPDGESYHPFIECKYTTFERPGIRSAAQSADISSIFAVKDSLVTVTPDIYTKKKKFKGKNVTLWIHVPNSMVVVKRDERGKESVYDN